MNYFYSSRGNIFTLYSCSKYSYQILTKYKIGEILYLKSSALKGLLEKIVIKKTDLFYKDTLNAYHNEKDLITYNEALVLIDQYLIYKNSQIEINNCS